MRMKQKSRFTFLPWTGFEPRTLQSDDRQRYHSTKAHTYRRPVLHLQSPNVLLRCLSHSLPLSLFLSTLYLSFYPFFFLFLSVCFCFLFLSVSIYSFSLSASASC